MTEAAVQEVASAPTTQDAWAMTNAIGDGDARRALRELALKVDEGEIPVMILGQLAWAQPRSRPWWRRRRSEPERQAQLQEAW
jgi:DNA polymerase III delta subunit